MSQGDRQIPIEQDYSRISSQLEDDFYDEFMAEIGQAVANPQSNHFDACGLRRANFNRFPFHFLYDVRSDSIRQTSPARWTRHRATPEEGLSALHVEKHLPPSWMALATLKP